MIEICCPNCRTCHTYEFHDKSPEYGCRKGPIENPTQADFWCGGFWPPDEFIICENCRMIGETKNEQSGKYFCWDDRNHQTEVYPQQKGCRHWAMKWPKPL